MPYLTRSPPHPVPISSSPLPPQASFPFPSIPPPCFSPSIPSSAPFYHPLPHLYPLRDLYPLQGRWLYDDSYLTTMRRKSSSQHFRRSHRWQLPLVAIGTGGNKYQWQ